MPNFLKMDRRAFANIWSWINFRWERNIATEWEVIEGGEVINLLFVVKKKKSHNATSYPKNALSCGRLGNECTPHPSPSNWVKLLKATYPERVLSKKKKVNTFASSD